MYFLLEREGGMAMGVLIIFFITSVPFVLIGLSRIIYGLKRILGVISIIYISFLSVFTFLNLDNQDWLIICGLGMMLIAMLIIELVKDKSLSILNYFGFLHLILFLIYVLL